MGIQGYMILIEGILVMIIGFSVFIHMKITEEELKESRRKKRVEDADDVEELLTRVKRSL